MPGLRKPALPGTASRATVNTIPVRHGLKSRLAGRDAVVTRSQRRHRVVPGEIRHSRPHPAGLFIDCAHRYPRDNRPLLISDRAPDAARRPLRIALRSAEEKTRCHKKAEFPGHDTLRFKKNQLLPRRRACSES